MPVYPTIIFATLRLSMGANGDEYLKDYPKHDLILGEFRVNFLLDKIVFVISSSHLLMATNFQNYFLIDFIVNGILILLFQSLAGYIWWKNILGILNVIGKKTLNENFCDYNDFSFLGLPLFCFDDSNHHSALICDNQSVCDTYHSIFRCFVLLTSFVRTMMTS